MPVRTDDAPPCRRSTSPSHRVRPMASPCRRRTTSTLRRYPQAYAQGDSGPGCRPETAELGVAGTLTVDQGAPAAGQYRGVALARRAHQSDDAEVGVLRRLVQDLRADVGPVRREWVEVVVSAEQQRHRNVADIQALADELRQRSSIDDSAFAVVCRDWRHRFEGSSRRPTKASRR